jgi:hypothetical protein
MIGPERNIDMQLLCAAAKAKFLAQTILYNISSVSKFGSWSKFGFKIIYPGGGRLPWERHEVDICEMFYTDRRISIREN